MYYSLTHRPCIQALLININELKFLNNSYHYISTVKANHFSFHYNCNLNL